MRLIDADELKNAFCMFCRMLESHEVDCKGDCMTHDIIDDEPTIEAEPVRHWRCDYCKDGKSFIGQTVILANDGKMHSIWYCPHCGAKLGG